MPANTPHTPQFGDGLPALPPHLDPRGKHRGAAAGSRSRWRPVFIGGKVLCTLLSIALVLTFAYAWWNYRDLNSNLRRLSITTGSDQAGQHDIDGKDRNILIVGNDDRTDMTNAEVKALKTGRDGGSLATDTMMIVHVPANGAKATLISLPRDAYVNIPGYGMNKLNSAYASAYTAAGGSTDNKRAAGANLLIQTISGLTGLTIDNFVQVDLIGFYRISNAVGGVTVNLCHAVDDPRYSHLVMSAGKHTIEGLTALEFVRQRHGLPNGDLDRVQRQRYFLTAAFRKIASAGTFFNPGRLRSLISAVDKSVYVDGGLNVTSLAEQLSSISANNIVGKTIPFEGYQTKSVGSVEIVDPAKVKAFVNTLVGTSSTALTKAKTVAPSSVSVRVVNAGARDGAAQQNAQTLTQQGFHASYASQTGQAAATAIEYASGMESQAKTLAAYVPGAILLKSDVSTLTLRLGTDGLSAQAKAKASAAPSAPASSSAKPAKAIDSGCIN